MVLTSFQVREMGRASGATTFVPKVQIEALQSVMPTKMTDPRETRQVSVTDPLGSGIFQRCLHIVFYYNKATEEDSGWLMAGWIKDSLGRALVEQPIFGGRLRPLVENGDREMELVSNDSGVRLVEAHMAITMAEFLDLKEREDAEAELVFWMDIDEQNPQFSPLFYIQVTNFQCGGYSVGISCSLLLDDPSAMIGFLKRWANIHNSKLLEPDMPKTPIFYLPKLKRIGCSSIEISSNSSKNSGQTMFFEISGKNVDLEDLMIKTPTFLCIEKAEEKLGTKMASKFSLFVKDSNGGIKVEICSKQGLGNPQLSSRSGLICSSWDDLGINEVAFRKGNLPAHVSYWIGLDSDGLVMVVPSRVEDIGSGMNIVVTIPSEEEI